MNANAEELRDRLVDFHGKKELTIYSKTNLFSAKFGSFANEMVDEQIVANLKDPSLAEWLLP